MRVFILDRRFTREQNEELFLMDLAEQMQNRVARPINEALTVGLVDCGYCFERKLWLTLAAANVAGHPDVPDPLLPEAMELVIEQLKKELENELRKSFAALAKRREAGTAENDTIPDPSSTPGGTSTIQ